MLDVVHDLEQRHGERGDDHEHAHHLDTEEQRHGGEPGRLQRESDQHLVVGRPRAAPGPREPRRFDVPRGGELPQHAARDEAVDRLAATGARRIVIGADARVVAAHMFYGEVHVEHRAEQQLAEPVLAAVAPVHELMADDDAEPAAGDGGGGDPAGALPPRRLALPDHRQQREQPELHREREVERNGGPTGGRCTLLRRLVEVAGVCAAQRVRDRHDAVHEEHGEPSPGAAPQQSEGGGGRYEVGKHLDHG